MVFGLSFSFTCSIVVLLRSGSFVVCDFEIRGLGEVLEEIVKFRFRFLCFCLFVGFKWVVNKTGVEGIMFRLAK